MKIKEILKRLLKKHVFLEHYTCNACNTENFNGEFLCDECKSKLEHIGANSCSHCGRKLIRPQEYCSTCKDRLLSTKMGKSIFVYKDTIAVLIQRFKYNDAKYIADYFAKEISNVYFKYYFATDFLTFVPMTKKAQRTRGYNQGELIVNSLSKIVNVPIFYGVEKVKNTVRQAKLGRTDRLKNLENSFKVIDKKSIKDKSITIIDDVTTTGATIETLAKALLKSGAKEIKYITIASVPPKSGY